MSQVSIIFLVSGTWKFLHVWLRVSAWDEECAELGDAIVSAQNSIKATSKPLGARPVWDLKLQLRCFGGSRGSKIGSMTEEERSILGGKKKQQWVSCNKLRSVESHLGVGVPPLKAMGMGPIGPRGPRVDKFQDFKTRGTANLNPDHVTTLIR